MTVRPSSDVGSISDISDLSSLPPWEDIVMPGDGKSSETKNLPETWDQWGSALKSLLQIPPTISSSAPKLRVGTLCSGTDAPIEALHNVIGDHVHHIYSVDHWEVSRNFISANFAPKHIFSRMDSILKEGGAPDCTCGARFCRAYREEVDILVMGFPCKPYSSLNQSRYTDTYNPFDHKEAKPIFIFQEFLKQERAGKPKVIILENVSGS